MTFSLVKRILGLLAFCGALLFAYTNCAGPISSSMNPDDLSSQGDSEQLKISPEGVSINWGASEIFEAAGGTPPYYFSIVTGGGTLEPYTGHYTAPSYDHTLVVQVRDANDQVAQTTAFVAFATSAGITLSHTPAKVNLGDVATLSASGGTAPYTYQVISGVGTITGNKYTATAFGTVVIGIVDSTGKQNSATIHVSSNVSLVTVPVFEWYNAQFKRTSYDLVRTTSAGWVNRSAGFRIMKGPVTGSTPLIRCRNADRTQFVLTTTAGCGSLTQDKVLGYVYLTKTPNSVALLSCFHNQHNDYLTTIGAAKCTSNGYARRGILGYAIAPPPP